MSPSVNKQTEENKNTGAGEVAGSATCKHSETVETHDKNILECVSSNHRDHYPALPSL